MSDRDVMQQALEALEDVHPSGISGAYTLTQRLNAIEALRARLAEPEPEPVAMADGTFNHNCPIGTPLYTAPPTRRPLTLEEIMDAVRDADLDWHTGWSLDEGAPNRYITFARDIERKITGGNDE